MCDQLTNAVVSAFATLKAVAGVAVIYRRQVDDTEISLTAVRGKTELETQEANGLHTRANVADFLVVAADLIVDGERFEPEAGDRITETLNGETLTHEVMSPGGTMDAWTWSDAGRSVIRLHTKLVNRS